MGQAYYRKYRSKKLDEVVGQEHITDTLKQALNSGKISHAYLFTGPRGVGKTSVARILAHEINGTKYSDESTDIDIIEIDAASNRRIDEIRELRDKVYVAPNASKYKVYIIDEVHMLTTPAFNALLKTLEEPPEHAVFILATTDAHKLPETIISRTQRYNFRPVKKVSIAKHLRHIATQEKINISDDALNLIAEHGEGSLRDSIGMLDQAQSSSGKVEINDIQNILGIPPASGINELVKILDSGSPDQIIEILNEIYEQGFQSSAVAGEIAKSLRTSILEAKTNNKAADLDLLRQLIEIPASHKPDQLLEIALISRQLSTLISTKKETAVSNSSPEPELKSDKKVVLEKSETSNNINEAVESKPPVTIKLSSDSWNLILKELKQRHNTLYGVVRMAEPKFETEKVILAFEFAFHEKKINQTNNRTVLSDVIESVTGHKYEIECILDKSATPPKIDISAHIVEPIQAKSDISSITNIFEGAELLES